MEWSTPLERIDARELIPLISGWRDNLSAYAALAQALCCALVSADVRLGKALAGSVPVAVV